MHIDKTTELTSFALRERHIITQGLVLGIEKLAEAEGAMREWSNMHDMGDLLRSPLFAPFATAILATGGFPMSATLFYYEEEPMEQPGS